MMVSTKGRYALRVMVDLAEHQLDGYIPLKEIANRQKISGKYLEAILKVLVRERLLIGLRGKGGGYRLSKPPEQYTVGSILRLTEGSLAPVACLGPHADQCSRSSGCRTLPMWKKFHQVVDEFFDGYTIADLMGSDQPGNDYGI
ncbi:MAG: RrF2 family transcriptional regulator [Oscillospiraceae bacterium]|jgi:Rrf2 family iron-sulfur cluster assembly transcriptional regulator|nr:RrF2 family transcriptional regulator [Oscillospiraceae bacterium]